MDTVIGIVVLALIVWGAIAAKNKAQPRVIIVQSENTGCGLLIAAGLLVLGLAGAALACF
jgi:hypothetical protein